MTPTELRALIASEQLASLASANAENGWPCTNDQLMADAIELADMLLAKLNGDAPDPSQSDTVVTSSIEWRPISSIKPENFDPCWVAAWDDIQDVISIRAAMWRESAQVEHEGLRPSGWCNSNGDAINFGSCVNICWRPLHHFRNVESARADFLGFTKPLLAKSTRPASPWLDATDPNNDPDDGDNAWVAVKGRKGWVVMTATRSKGRSEWLTKSGRNMFGVISERDLVCYHCPLDSFANFDDAVASLPDAGSIPSGLLKNSEILPTAPEPDAYYDPTPDYDFDPS